MPAKCRIDGLQSLSVYDGTDPQDGTRFVLTASVPVATPSGATKDGASTVDVSAAAAHTLSSAGTD